MRADIRFAELGQLRAVRQSPAGARLEVSEEERGPWFLRAILSLAPTSMMDFGWRERRIFLRRPTHRGVWIFVVATIFIAAEYWYQRF